MLELSREFQVLASHLNFTTAARELNVSQPALSRHINELERSVGFRLLDRNPVRLTGAGNHYLEGINHIIGEYDTLISECKRLAAQDHLELSIAMILSNDDTTFYVYNTLSRLHEMFPNFSYQFADDRKGTVEQMVSNGTADIGIVYFESQDAPSGLVTSWMYDDRFIAWMHEDNPLTQHPAKFSDITPYTIVFSANRVFQTWIEGMQHACETYGASPNYRMKNLDRIADFLISLQPDELVLTSASSINNLQRFNSHLRPVAFTDEKPLTYPVYLIYKEQHLNPAIGAFVDTFKKLVSKDK